MFNRSPSAISSCLFHNSTQFTVARSRSSARLLDRALSVHTTSTTIDKRASHGRRIATTSEHNSCQGGRSVGLNQQSKTEKRIPGNINIPTSQLDKLPDRSGRKHVVTSQQESELIADEGKNSHWNVLWQGLYQRLSFPGDGDFEKAREGFTVQRAAAMDYIKSVKAGQAQELLESRPLNASLIPSILIGSLAEAPEDGLFVLSQFERLPRDFYTRAACLQYIYHAWSEQLEQDEKLKQLFSDQIRYLCESPEWPMYYMRPSILNLFLQNSSRSEGETVAERYTRTYPFERLESFLHILDFYTKHKDVDKALEVLEQLPPIELQKEHVVDRCVNLLLLDTIDRATNSQNFRILPQLLRLGVPASDILHNVVIQNAVSSGLANVAWDLYHYMRDEKLKILPRTYLVLLRDSFLRKDVQGLNDIMSSIHSRTDLASDPYLVAYSMNIVRVICFHERRASPRESLSHLLALYDRAYDREPLIKIGLVRTRSPKASLLPAPGSAALGFTIWSYVLVQRQVGPVLTLWANLVRLIKMQDSTVVEAAKHDVLYNGFLLFFSRLASTIIHGLDVLQFMLDANLCMPTERTWSIIICAFLKHNQNEAAEKVRHMMRARNVTMSKDGWQFVLDQYPGTDLAAKIRAVLNEEVVPESLETAMGLTDIEREEIHKLEASTGHP